MPIVCVDGAVLYSNKILYLKRSNEPEKGKWWLPGGRLLKGELLENAIVRKVKEETNLMTKVIRQIGVTQTGFTTGPSGIPVHTINITFLLRPIGQEGVKIDENHSEYEWLENCPEDMHPEIKRIVSEI